ncbi:DUF2786 domain-containing protein [Methylobacterium sp. NPDC080182]|uniref:DUF2786 domain-containing protein n=1 Tax=Methylobacterium sp. NPDC080182 TaxID=3390590 RepID=UPI003CFEFD2A
MAKKSAAFDLATLTGEASTVIREALAGIDGRRDAKKDSRRDWMRDGLDVIRIRRVAPHGTLEAILRTSKVKGLRQLGEYASAVELLAGALKSEIIADFPETAASTVCALLARDKTPKPVVDEFLPRILAGQRVKLADVNRAIDAIENPKSNTPEPDPAADRPDDRAEAVQRFLSTLGDAERELLRRLSSGLPDGLTLDLLAGADLHGPAPDAPEPEPEQEPEPESDADPEPFPDPTEDADPGVDPEPEPKPSPEPDPQPDPAQRGSAQGGAGNRDSAIRRIRALMSKTIANGCTEAEAMTATEMVRHLLDKYALSMSDLEIQSQTCERRRATEKAHDVERVAHAISIFTGTKVWVTGGCLVYFGLPHDVEVAQFLTDLCRNAMDSAFRKYLREYRFAGVDGRSARKTFMTTMANRLSRRIEAMAAERNATAKTGSGSSLVVVRDTVVDRQFEALRLRINKRKRQGRHNFDPLAHEAALIAAEQVGITTGIDQGDREQVAA